MTKPRQPPAQTTQRLPGHIPPPPPPPPQRAKSAGYSITEHFEGLRDIEPVRGLPRKVQRWQALPLFAGMEDGALQRIQSAMEPVAFATGEQIVTQGEPGEHMFVMESGKVRIVVSDQNPGVTNWVETLGHRKGYLQFRWQRLSRALTAADGPTVEVVAVDQVAAALPHYASNKISDDDWRARIALRQKQIGDRMVG